MNINQITLHDQKHSFYSLTILLGLCFFGLTLYFKSNLDDITVPFTITFLGIVLLSLIIRRYETFILLLLINNSTIFQLWDFPIIPIIIGELFFSDVLILVLLLGWLLKKITVNVTLIPKPLGTPIALFICVAIFSFMYAITAYDVSFARAGTELRSIFHFFLFFIVIYYVKDYKQLNTLLLGIGIIATTSALLLAIQHTFGLSTNLVAGRYGALRIAGNEISNITRILIPGMNLIFFTVLTLICLFVLKGIKRKGRVLLVPVIMVLISAIILTFARSLWISLAFSTLIILFFQRHRISLYPSIVLLCVSILIGFTLIYQAKSPYLHVIKDAVYQRTISIVDASKNYKNDTLYIRFMEYQLAWAKIKEHPFLGIGLGNRYRQAIFGNITYEKTVGGTEVHNGFMAVQLKMGLAGTFTLFWLIFIYFKRTLRKWKQINNPLYQAIVLGIFASMCSFLFQNSLGTLITKASWVSVIAVGMGISEKIFQLNDKSNTSQKAEISSEHTV